MFRPPAALLHSSSVFYMTESPLAYVACDGRKIQLRAVQGNDNSSPPRHAPARGFGHWEFVPGCIVDDCLFVGMRATGESTSVWALYDAGYQPEGKPSPFLHLVSGEEPVGFDVRRFLPQS